MAISTKTYAIQMRCRKYVYSFGMIEYAFLVLFDYVFDKLYDRLTELKSHSNIYLLQNHVYCMMVDDHLNNIKCKFSSE